MELLDYETIEISLGDRLRRQDCLDIHADRFFPVTILDMLFHYSEELTGTEIGDKNRLLHRNFHGHDFDRWIDNLIAKTRIHIADEDGNIESVELVDVDSMLFDGETILVTLPDNTRHTLLIKGTKDPLRAASIDEIKLQVDLDSMFNHPPVDEDAEPYLGFGPLAHIVRVVCDKSGIDPVKVNCTELSERIFSHFKNEMLPLIPSMWNDMEHILHYATPTLFKY